MVVSLDVSQTVEYSDGNINKRCSARQETSHNRNVMPVNLMVLALLQKVNNIDQTALSFDSFMMYLPATRQKNASALSKHCSSSFCHQFRQFQSKSMYYYRRKYFLCVHFSTENTCYLLSRPVDRITRTVSISTTAYRRWQWQSFQQRNNREKMSKCKMVLVSWVSPGLWLVPGICRHVCVSTTGPVVAVLFTSKNIRASEPHLPSLYPHIIRYCCTACCCYSSKKAQHHHNFPVSS